MHISYAYKDLEACVWLEEELKTYASILVMISHSQVSNSWYHSSSFVRIVLLIQRFYLSINIGLFERSLYKYNGAEKPAASVLFWKL